MCGSSRVVFWVVQILELLVCITLSRCITPPRSILFEYTLDPSSMLMTEARQKYCPYIMVLTCPKECNLINN